MCGYNHTVAFLPRPKLPSKSNLFVTSLQNSECTSFSHLEYFSSLLKHVDTIEVPRTMLSDISNDIPDYVSVHALSRIDYGNRVLVEPATVEDWELLDIYSNLIEEGGLLSQVSVIYPTQHLAIRIDGVDRVKIRVSEVTTRECSNPENDVHQIWPDFSSDGSNFSNRPKEKKLLPQCVLLIQDTEIIVEPKTRLTRKNTPWLDPLRLIPSDADWGASFEKLSKTTGRDSFHVEPGCVLVEAEQWPFESEWAQIRSDNPNQMRIVRVMTSSRIPRNNAGTLIASISQVVFVWIKSPTHSFDDEQ